MTGAEVDASWLMAAAVTGACCAASYGAAWGADPAAVAAAAGLVDATASIEVC